MKKHLLLFVGLAAGYITNADAQLVYHDINPDTTVNSWNNFTATFAGKANNITGKFINVWWHPNPEVVINAFDSVQVLHDATGTYPAKLKLGDSIVPTGQWKKVNYAPLNSSGMGNWQNDAADKYLGFRYQDNGVWRYGWLKMTVAAGAASFTVKEWAHNSGKIKAGQTSTTQVSNMVRDDVNIQIINKKIHFSNLRSATRYTVRITDISGRAVEPTIVLQQGVKDISDLPQGIYICTLAGDGSNYNFKIAVQ
jgi:hypothetical protein